MGEEYSWIKTGMELEKKIIDPSESAPPKWIVEYKYMKAKN